MPVVVLTILRGPNPDAPGPWWRPLRLSEGGTSAWMRCPSGHDCTLTDHTIHPDGKVEPSVVCPLEGCTFHEHIRLEGWP